jgi:hypothetical protein
MQIRLIGYKMQDSKINKFNKHQTKIEQRILALKTVQTANRVTK